MSDNPLDPSPERQAEVTARALRLWHEAGSPPGGADAFMEQADELVRMEHAGNPGQRPNPMTRDEPIPGVTVEEASIQENLGEFPGGATTADQGEWHQTPMTRENLRHGGDEQPLRGDAPSREDAK